MSRAAPEDEDTVGGRHAAFGAEEADAETADEEGSDVEDVGDADTCILCLF